jgi:hypothetical protein
MKNPVQVKLNEGGGAFHEKKLKIQKKTGVDLQKKST